MDKQAKTGIPLKLKLVSSLALAVLLCGATARAEEAKAKPAAAPHKKAARHHHRAKAAKAARHKATAKKTIAERPLAQLRGEVGNLRRAQAETNHAVREIQREIAVVPTGGANAAPRTIGEHVGALERDLNETRRSVAENLGVHVHGLVDATYEYNFNTPLSFAAKGGSPQAFVPGGSLNRFRQYDVDANGFELTQFNLHVDRTVEGGVGFVFDLNFGKTAEILRAQTRYTNSSAAGGTIGNDVIDPTQAYLTYAVPVGHGLNLEAGKYNTLLGAEVIDSYNNLNYNESRGLLYTFGVPHTHTGIRANYAFTDRIGATLGLNNGWDDVADNNDGKSLEGQVALTPVDSLSIALNGTYGPEQVNRGNSQLGIIDGVATWKTPIRHLTAVAEYLYANETGPVAQAVPFVNTPSGNGLFAAETGVPVPACKAALATAGTGFASICNAADWQGAAGYLIYDFTSRASLALRGEYFRDSDGIRTGIRQSIGEFTGTFNYKLSSGLLARFEYRHDESNTNSFLSGNPAVGSVGHPAPATFVAAGLPSTIKQYSGQDTVEGALIYAF